MRSSGVHVDSGSIPLYFTANRGQVDKQALFYAKTSRYTLWLTEKGLVFDSYKSEKRNTASAEYAPFLLPDQRKSVRYDRDVCRLVFLGASRNPEIVPLDEASFKVHYFIGQDRVKWRTAVPTSGAVLYKNIYDRIDLKVYGAESRIEYDWIVRPGGDPRDIRFKYENAKDTRLDGEGDLLVETAFGELRHKKPEAYQKRRDAGSNDGSADARRVSVASAFRKIGENEFGFEVGAFEPDSELVIDPVVLAYSTMLGGTGYDEGWSIRADDSGHVYVTGQTTSANFPVLNSNQTDQPGSDVFVTKIDTTQSGAAALVYSTYFGGNSTEEGWAIAVDSAGNAYVGGRTSSSNLPLLNQYQAYRGGGAGEEGFVFKLNTAGVLAYSTYLGGSNGGDNVSGVAADDSGCVYATGYTYCTNYPVRNGYQMTNRGGSDVFVTKLDTTLSGDPSLVYSTYLGGGSNDASNHIAVAGTGIVYVSAYTYGSANFPVLHQYQTYQGSNDGLVFKIDTTLTGAASLLYSTYLGGTGGDGCVGIAADDAGHAYVSGITASGNFPIVNAYQSAFRGVQDAFVAKIDTTLSGAACLEYSSLLGGTAYDLCRGVAVDGSGNIYITGSTLCSDFPIKNQYQSFQGGSDAYVAKFDPTQSGEASLVYSTYLGASNNDGGINIPSGIAVDGAGSAYVTGATWSTNFPTVNPYQTWQGGGDAFISKIRASADVAITKTADNLTPNVGETFHYTVTATNNGPMTATGLRVLDALPAGVSYQSSTPSKGIYDSGTGLWTIDALAVSESATLTLTVVGTWGVATHNVASVFALNEADPDASNDWGSADVTIKFTLTIVADAGGTTNPAPGTYAYDDGDVVIITAVPAGGYRFGVWSGDASGTANPVSVTMNANKTVTASFVRQYTLMVGVGPGGTTHPAPGDYLVDEGAVAAITALPSTGFRFGSWSGDVAISANSAGVPAASASGNGAGRRRGGAAEPSNTISIVMDGDKTVTANFIRQYTLTIGAGEGGTTSPAPGTYTYDAGTAVSVQAVPAAAYKLESWTGDASGSANPATIVMSGNKAILANFTRAVGAPLGLTGDKLSNRNVSSVEYVARLRWQHNPSNTGVTGYRIYQIDNGPPTVISNVGPGTNEHIIRKIQAAKTYRFGVTAINGLGWESDMAQVVVQ